jgi:dienelactone hydrolase
MKKGIVILFVVFSLSTDAQKSLNVLDWKTEYSLNTYLLQQMHIQYDARRQAFDRALSGSMQQYIRSAKNRYQNLIGDALLNKRLSNPVVTGMIREEGYRIEKIVYESYTSHHITANLYVPQGKGPFPAVLLFCGHEDISKATPSYQQTAILFARNGYVVLVVDPVSQSERYQITDNTGKPLTRGGTTEHTLLNAASNLLGMSTPVDELADNKISLDYLVTRPEVDTKRIGCLGNSGGAMQTIYFAGYDPRIKVTASCSYLATRERTLELTGPADGCAQMPGEGKEQLEFTDYLLMAAPKPVMILAGRYDFIDYHGTEKAYDELKKAYTVLGQADKVSIFTYDDGHGISQPKREAAVQWFNRWLKNDNSPVHEKEVSLKTPAQLLVTTTGQVQSAFPGEISIVQRNLKMYESLQRARKEETKTKKEHVDLMRQFVRIHDTGRSVNTEDMGIVKEHGFDFHKKIIRKENEIPLPALVVYPPGTATKLMIWANDKGKMVTAANDSLRIFTEQGYIVILCDLRGTGETEDKAEFNDPKYYNREYRNAMLALHTGRSLVLQRTTDILSVMDMIRQDKQLSALPVELNVSGINSVPALHAAMLNQRISKLYISGGIKTYREIFINPSARDWYSYVVPGMLKYYDIPELESVIGKDKIQWLN